MADIKITEMLVETAPESTDVLPLVRPLATVAKNRKITLASLLAAIPSSIVTVFGISTGGWQTVNATGAMVPISTNVHVDIGVAPITIVVPNGTVDGQELLFVTRTAASTATVSPLNSYGPIAHVLNTVGDSVTLKWDGTKWAAISSYNT